MRSIISASMEIVGTLVTIFAIGLVGAALLGGGHPLPLPAGDATLSSCTVLPMDVEAVKEDRL